MQIPYYEGKISYGYLLEKIDVHLISSENHNYCYMFTLKYDYTLSDIDFCEFYNTFQKIRFKQRSRWLNTYYCKLEKIDWFISNGKLIIYLLGQSYR